jgi:hypothetical protein
MCRVISPTVYLVLILWCGIALGGEKGLDREPQTMCVETTPDKENMGPLVKKGALRCRNLRYEASVTVNDHEWGSYSSSDEICGPRGSRSVARASVWYYGTTICCEVPCSAFGAHESFICKDRTETTKATEIPGSFFANASLPPACCPAGERLYRTDLACDCDADGKTEFKKSFSACLPTSEMQSTETMASLDCEEFIDIPPTTVPNALLTSMQTFLAEGSFHCPAFDCKKQRAECAAKADKFADKCGLLHLTPPGRDNRACNEQWLQQRERCYEKEAQCFAQIFQEEFGPMPAPAPTPTPPATSH